MENLIKVEIKLICYLSDDEDDRVDFNTDIELSEDNYHKLITVVKNTGIAYECLMVGYTRPFIIITDGFEEADKINNVVQNFLEKTQNCQERKKIMENKINVAVYIYYGDDQSKHSDYLYNCFRALKNDCDRIYNSLVDSSYVCACRSTKAYSGDTMAFRLSCQNKDDALKVFARIEELNETKDEVRVLVNINFKSCLFGDDCTLQFDEKFLTDDYCKIVAFLKDCDLVTSPFNIDGFDNLKFISITCSTETDALTIKKGLDGIVKKNNGSVSKVDDTLVNEENSTPENNSISSEIDYIAKNLDDTDLFLQLAEEAAELSQACLKYVRAYRGNNPTKDSADVYLKNIIEEFTDVRVSADALNIEEDIDTYINKIHRWANRIRKKNGGNTK